jgi:hypothetical protein
LVVKLLLCVLHRWNLVLAALVEVLVVLVLLVLVDGHWLVQLLVEILHLRLGHVYLLGSAADRLVDLLELLLTALVLRVVVQLLRFAHHVVVHLVA